MPNLYVRPVRTRTGRGAIIAAGTATLTLAALNQLTTEPRMTLLGDTVYAHVVDLISLIVALAAGAHLLVCARQRVHPVAAVYACAALAGLLPLVVPMLNA